jgi:hypothetical protein
MDLPTTAALAPAEQLSRELTRKHYSRLRFYWQNRRAHIQGGALDLDLQRLGLIRLSDAGTSYSATEAGAQALAEQTVRDRERRAPHHELGGRVAQWLQEQGRMTWDGVEFRVREPDVYARAKAMAIDVGDERGVLFSFPRPDVFSVVQSFDPERINPLVHEIKVSRADYLADVANPLKRLAYACIADAVHYVLPAGLVEPHEVPTSCGLIVELEPGAFKVLKRAKKRAVTMSAANFMCMVIKPGSRSTA